jgi:predicted transcriptional regulator
MPDILSVRILRLLHNIPGLSATEMGRMLQKRTKVVHMCLRKLVAKGVLLVEQDQRALRCRGGRLAMRTVNIYTIAGPETRDGDA